METFCVRCKKNTANTANKNSSVRSTRQNRVMLVLDCAICGKKNQGSLKTKKLADLWAS